MSGVGPPTESGLDPCPYNDLAWEPQPERRTPYANLMALIASTDYSDYGVQSPAYYASAASRCIAGSGPTLVRRTLDDIMDELGIDADANTDAIDADEIAAEPEPEPEPESDTDGKPDAETDAKTDGTDGANTETDADTDGEQEPEQEQQDVPKTDGGTKTRGKPPMRPDSQAAQAAKQVAQPDHRPTDGDTPENDDADESGEESVVSPAMSAMIDRVVATVDHSTTGDRARLTLPAILGKHCANRDPPAELREALGRAVKRGHLARDPEKRFWIPGRPDADEAGGESA